MLRKYELLQAFRMEMIGLLAFALGTLVPNIEGLSTPPGVRHVFSAGMEFGGISM